MSKTRTTAPVAPAAPVVDLNLTQAPIEQPDFVAATLDLAAEAAAAPVVVAARRGRTSPFGEAQIVEVLVAANPKKASGKSRARFDLYRTGMTVGEYLTACVALEGARAWPRHRYLADLHWDSERKFVVTHPAGTNLAAEADAEETQEA